MRSNTIFRQIVPAFLAIPVMGVVVALFYVSHLIQRIDQERIEKDLLIRTHLAGIAISPLLSEPSKLQTFVEAFEQISGTRLTILLPNGVILADSDKKNIGKNYEIDRPTIEEAFRSGIARSVRPGNTWDTTWIEVAIRLGTQENPTAILHTSLFRDGIEGLFLQVHLPLVGGGLILVILALAIASKVAQRIAVPLRTLSSGAQRFARQEFSPPLPETGPSEIADLAHTLNEMAASTRAFLETIRQGREEQQAMFRSMTEGILAVDRENRILQINPAAATFFGIDPASCRNRLLYETLRIPALLSLADRILAGEESVAADITIHRDSPLELEARGAALRTSDGSPTGALIVLRDVTELRRLEKIRREFVENAGHELRTPVTAIQCALETLLDTPPEDQKTAHRFLRMAVEHVRRLTALIHDLMTLARLERVELSPTLQDAPLAPMLQSAIEACQPLAENRQVPLILEVDESLTLPHDASMLERAVINLVDNAIKHSSPGSPVIIRAFPSERGAILEVEDHGCGIEARHLPRLFERFYRVDKARSRKEGGTGLGLAIVKHTAMAHGGTVSVESRLGVGSRFRIEIPRCPVQEGERERGSSAME